MHPILGNGRRLAIYLLAWVLVGALLSVALRCVFRSCRATIPVDVGPVFRFMPGWC